MDPQIKRKPKRRRRFPLVKKRFQASFLHPNSASGSQRTGISNPSPVPSSTSSRPDQDVFRLETLTRLHYRFPADPKDYRPKLARASQELKHNSRLVRQTLSHGRTGSTTESGKTLRKETTFRTLERLDSAASEGKMDTFPKVNTAIAPRLLVSGFGMTIDKDLKEDLPPTRPATVAKPQFLYEKPKKTAVSEQGKSDQFQLKYFNADIIPKKPERTVTLADLQNYLQYLGTKPFK